MCVIAAKYFADTGWILAKNRDQDYIPDMVFRDVEDKNVGEILVMFDNDIEYQEGMNYNGLVIISTSLTPTLIDELNKEDGQSIYEALHMKQRDAVKHLIRKEVTGFIFVGTPETLIVIEAARTNGGVGEYKAKVRQIPKTETIVRTNHGVSIPWGGFQYGVSEYQDFRRRSSESRMRIGEKVLQNAKSPVEMLDALASRVDDDLQMNVFRLVNKPRQMRTIFQWALIPSQDLAIIRPVQTKMKLNISHKKLRIEILDNEPLKRLYKGRIKYFSDVKISDNGKEYKTVIKEDFLTFGEFSA